MIAFDPAQPLFPAPSSLVEGWLTVLGFRELTLTQLGLTPGPQPSIEVGRPLPLPDARARWTTDGWRAEVPGLEGLEALRLPPIDAARCASAQLCLDSESGECEACQPDPAAVLAPAAPTPPAPLEATCPASWHRMGPEDRPACTWSHPGPCALGEVALPGDQACGPVLSACPPNDGFPPLGSARTLHVRSGVVAGDGSPAAPFAELEDALALAAPGDRVSLAPGRYTASQIPPEVEVVGACAARVVLAGPALRLMGGTLRDVTLELPLLIAGTSTLEGIRSREVEGVAFNVEPGAALQARRLSIQGASGGGVVVSAAQAVLEQVEVQSSGTFSVWVGSSTVSFAGLAIDFGAQVGGVVALRSRLSLTDFLIHGSAGHGIDGQLSGLELSNGTVVTADGLGVSLHRGALALRQVWFKEVPSGAVALHRAAGVLVDLRVEGTPRFPAAAVRSDSAKEFSVTRAAITGFAAGIRLVSTPGTVRDVVISELTSADLNAPRSVGIQANGVGPFYIERARIGGFIGHAIAIAGAGAPGAELLPELVRVEDLDTFALSADLEDKGGVGFFEEGAAAVELRRLRIRGASQRGVEIRGFPTGTDLVVEDLYVEGSAVGVERAGYGSSVFFRTELRDISGRGIELRGRPFRAEALRVIGSGGQRGLSLTPSEVTDDPIEIKDFQIVGPLGAAVVANGSVRGIWLVDGEISNVDVAFGLPGEGAAFHTQNVILDQRPGQRVSAVAVP